jgi:TonB family C-terminal domain
MEIKKSPKANLEKMKTLFLEIGFIVALVIVFFAFDHKASARSESTLAPSAVALVEEEIIPITRETPPPPPEMPKEPIIPESFDIVEDDIKVEHDFLITSEDNKDMKIEIRDFVSTSVAVEEVIEEEEILYQIVEEKPTFQGKEANAFTAWVSSRIVYPEIATENGVQGKVFLSFIIDVDGSLKDIKVQRSVDPELDAEAVRVVASSPKWKPGRQQDRAVKVRYTFPVNFQLQ